MEIKPDHEQIREWIKSHPEPPLSNNELRLLRTLLDDREKAIWLRKRRLIWAPAVITILSALASVIWFLFEQTRP